MNHFKNDSQGQEKIKYVLRKALGILCDEVTSINSVSDWAKRLGMSQTWLRQATLKHFGVSPVVLLRDFRFRKIIVLIEKEPLSTSYGVAQAAGLADEKALYKFLTRNYKINFTKLREDVIGGAIQSRNILKFIPRDWGF